MMGPKCGRSSLLGVCRLGVSLCVASVLLVLLSHGRWAATSAAAQKTASPPDDNPRLDERAPRIPSQYWENPAGLADETPQQLRAKEDLLRLIERVQAIRLSRKGRASSQPTEPNTPTTVIDPARVTVPANVSEPNVVSSPDPNKSQSEIPSSPVPSPTAPKPLPPPLPLPVPPPLLPAAEPNDTLENTLALLEALSGRAHEIDRPFEMAELLRGSGFLAEAASYYRVALERMNQDDPLIKRRRAWALFQAGSCVRRKDPAAAARMFRQLVTEHPDSIWKEPTEIWLAIADWYATEKPGELIESLRQVDGPTGAAQN